MVCPLQIMVGASNSYMAPLILHSLQFMIDSLQILSFQTMRILDPNT